MSKRNDAREDRRVWLRSPIGAAIVQCSGVAARGWEKSGWCQVAASMRGAQGPGCANAAHAMSLCGLYTRRMLHASRRRQPAASYIMRMRHTVLRSVALHCAVQGLPR